VLDDGFFVDPFGAPGHIHRNPAGHLNGQWGGLRRRRGKALAPRFGFVFDQHRIDVLMAVRLMLVPTCLQAGLQPFDIAFVDDANRSPIVLVPLSKLFSHLGCGAAIESDGLDLGHVVLPSPPDRPPHSRLQWR
jgi:hypothetical protein